MALPASELHLFVIQLEISLHAALEEGIQISTMVLCGLLQCVSKSHNHRIVCYHFHTSKALNDFMHPALKNLRGRTDSEGHSPPPVLSKWGVESGE